MTENETLGRMNLGDSYEKPFYESKKFIAFLLMEVLLGGLVLYALYALRMAPDIAWPLAAFMIGLVVTMGTIALTFNGYQAKLDMYVRGMALTGQVPKDLMERFAGSIHNPRIYDRVLSEEEVSAQHLDGGDVDKEEGGS